MFYFGVLEVVWLWLLTYVGFAWMVGALVSWLLLVVILLCYDLVVCYCRLVWCLRGLLWLLVGVRCGA